MREEKAFGIESRFRKQTQEYGSANPIDGSTESISQQVFPGVDRQAFLMRSAVIGPTTVILGQAFSTEDRPTAPAQRVSKHLHLVQTQKGPVMTTLDELYTVETGPSTPKKNQPKYPYSTMKELRQHAETNNLTIAQVILENELAVSGKSEQEVYAFIDEVVNAMVLTVKAGLSATENGVSSGPGKLRRKAGTVYKQAMDETLPADRGLGVLSAYALAASEENESGHFTITAPTTGSAGVLPALVYGLGEGGRRLPKQKIRLGMLAAAAIGFLCKHNATLSTTEDGYQAEIGVASAMAAALVATANDASPRVVENAAVSALEHHLGMSGGPFAGCVQVSRGERCALGAVKAWTAYAITRNEVASRQRVDLDATIAKMAQIAREMNSHREASEARLALSVVLC